MTGDRPQTGPYAVAERISRAISDHDLDALADCFTSDYVSEWPVHPARTFTGPEQVRENWGRMLAAVPDLTTRILGYVVSGGDVWTEWEFAGNRLDGQPHLMRGIIVLHTEDGRATRSRFFLEPVDTSPDDATAAVQRLLTEVRASRAGATP
ncbi:MAG: hypothetical protein JWO79_715 [Actinomycetia bacterium]|jgi:ketosteroid isomerase-like protein|nr:hypothetical protein [Actinomycetes bacterium]MDQ1651564.1 hypothetical protein [Cryptosporangiaceae bacterium]MDQ1655119.1 hypothetical protein [Cryptosporangiaceae bacterium]